jgi:exodeoxyribonuclease V beta subunit
MRSNPRQKQEEKQTEIIVMTKPTRILDSLAFPLTGSHLIEASAGTGKTFTIAMLYVRLVLGQGGDNAFTGGPLTPPRILVVTFTIAATKELRDRIRARLSEAAHYFRAVPEGIQQPAGPDLLHALRATYPPEEWPACARQLELAAQSMDEAAVSTIHAWCSRMLGEHAFDSLSLFSQTLETDHSELLAEVVRDYWRTFYYPMSCQELDIVLRFWNSLEDLHAKTSRLLPYASLLACTDSPKLAIQECQTRQKQILDELKKPWAAWADELEALFDEAKAKKNFDGRKLRENSYKNWFSNIRTWANDPNQSQLEIGSGWDRLTPEGIADAWTKGDPPDHEAFSDIPSLRAALANLPDPRNDLLQHATRWIAETFETARQRQSEMGLNDLLTQLDKALQGPHGHRLAEIIRRQYPVALIDEFQDTDPVQYRIFDNIYRIRDNRRDCGLILIGDPKQAIYAFRGADIYTYLTARKDIAGRLYTLDTNFRSTESMVKATNHWFNRVETLSDSEGAFLFRKNGDNPVPFLNVIARGRKDDFQLDGKVQPGMTLALLTPDEPMPKNGYLAEMAEVCATRIVDWLTRGHANKAGFSGVEDFFRPVRPDDMAILVNNRIEANQIRYSLSRRGVRSVYLSDNDSIYSSQQAEEMLRWLAACADPDNDRLLRAALSTETLGLSLKDLDALNTDEIAWEQRLLQFRAYQDIWRHQGVLPLIRRILFDFGCSHRLLAQATDASGQSGERILTDILHLGELLQHAGELMQGEQALLRFLAEAIADPAAHGSGDTHKLRLENDADLVKVITIHKSKGLEYPLVFLPFICATRFTRKEDLPFKYHDPAGQLSIALDHNNEIHQQVERERLGEDLRKLYVALTRARYHTWVGLAPMRPGGSGSDINAVSHLLGLQSHLDTPKKTPPLKNKDAQKEAEENAKREVARKFSGSFQNGVNAFAGDLPQDFKLELDPVVNEDPFEAAELETKTGKARTPVHPAWENWWIGSYSSLKFEGAEMPAAPPVEDDSADSENLLSEDSGEAEVAIVEPVSAHDHSLHAFPRGAHAGTFLHDILEWVANQGFSNTLADTAALRDLLARRCHRRGWEAWIDPLVAWTGRLLSSPLPVDGKRLRLGDIGTAKAEMEFWFAASAVNLKRLDEKVIQYTLPQRPRPRLAPNQLNGMLKGFMDLVFEHEGRYYVADYKSNWLGTDDAAYTADAMAAAILGHRYDLQYAIYLFALHRLLKSRLPDYDYDRHIGGAIYLFVRGIDAPTAGVHFERPPKALMDEMENLFSAHTEAAQ